MADSKSRRSEHERKRAACWQGYRIGYFARKHGISRDQAADLIKSIGNDRDALNAAAAKLKQ